MAHRAWGLVAVAVLGVAAFAAVRARAGDEEKPWERNKRLQQDAMSGLSEAVLARQSLDRVTTPSKEEALAAAMEAARKEAEPLLDAGFHKGRTRLVPREFKTIQAAIDASASGDVVRVEAGTYYEQLTMKDGVRLVSDAGTDGDELVPVEGALLKLPRRTTATILDGSKAKPSPHGMIDFAAGSGRNTVVDGFTLTNLPKQDHHQPNHAHGVNIRGASPTILRCWIHHNGSTGIGSHAVFKDHESPVGKRDFRAANVKHDAKALLYGNVVSHNFGLGIGCNHLSAPTILGNDVFGNDDTELTGEPTPGMGIKHGASPTIVGNVVHQNAGGGILAQVGEPMGAKAIDVVTHPTIRRNFVFGNGKANPGVAARRAGSEALPVVISGNVVVDAGLMGIGLTEESVGTIEDNLVSGASRGGIAVDASRALRLLRNRVTGVSGPGFLLVEGAVVDDMAGNAASGNEGPRFMAHGAKVAEPAAMGD